LLSVVYRVQVYLFKELLPQTSENSAQDYEPEELRAIAKVFCSVCGSQNEAETYWCYSSFLQQRERIYGHHAAGIHHQVLLLSRLLKKYAPDVQRHLSLHSTLDDLSYKWFRGYFSSCLPLHSLERLWDKVIAVSHDFLACAGCAFILHLRHKILDINNPRDLKLFLNNLPKMNLDQVITKATELYTELQESPKVTPSP